MQSEKIAKNSALGLYVYTLIIIVWGAWVRISGSGDGCGEHWPLCHGQVIPEGLGLETYIEFFHRLKSGLYGFLVLGFLWWAFKKFPKSHVVRQFSVWILILTFVEAGLGAALVLTGSVGDTNSGLRAVIMVLHQVNSLLLAGAIGLLFWIAAKKNWKFKWSQLKRRASVLGLIIGLACFGALAALASTLFPSESLASGIATDLDPNSPWLIQLRVVHPILALLIFVEIARKCRKKVFLVYSVGVLFGISTLLLLSPTWMKLSHLLFAHLIWFFILEETVDGQS